jgi:hypothetical protein
MTETNVGSFKVLEDFAKENYDLNPQESHKFSYFLANISFKITF